MYKYDASALSSLQLHWEQPALRQKQDNTDQPSEDKAIISK
jgi:hypothetical protein